MSQHSCQEGHIWGRCGAAAASSCVYCGRWFCSEHGGRTPENIDVCVRPRCQSKTRDLAEHQLYVGRMEQRNRVGICGLDSCEERYTASCSGCRGFYCGEHVSSREDRRTIDADRRMVATCDHCWKRRALWSRRG
ncbi:MAG: hypothetical protein WEB00_11630 [Dehalococcoidia bacterium]